MDAFETTIDLPLGDAEAAIRHTLAEEGFGILTEIDVAATLEAKLGIKRPPLKILGACNPSFAHRALTADPSLALVLPCNVVLEDIGDGHTRVSVADPRALLAFADPERKAEAYDLGEEAASALKNAVDQLER